MNTQLKNVAKALAPYQKELQYLSFTIDPTNDTPSKLKQHKNKLGITNPNWAFLSGNEAFTHQLGIEHFLIFAGREDEALGGYAHSGAFTLVDKKGYVRGVYEVVQPDLSVNKKEFADPNLSCIGFVCYQYGIFIEEGKTWNALIDGVGGGFSVVLAIRNIVIP